MSKTVLITIRYGLAARNVLRTGTFRGLRDAGYKIVIVCPAAHEAYLRDEIGGPTVTLEPFPAIRSTWVEEAFAAFADGLLFDHQGTTETMTIKWHHMRAQGKLLPFLAKGAAGVLQLHRSRSLRRLAERFDRRLFDHAEIAGLFDRVQPQLLVTTDLFGGECHFVREGRRRGIRAVCLVKSWDNLTSKGRIRIEPDYLVVWSELMKSEAVRLHFIPADRVFVSGAPNFDFFAPTQFRSQPRAEFLRRLGVPPDAKLIVYSPGHKFTRSDDENIRRIQRIIHSGVLGVPAHLHVRKYPKASQDFSHLLGLGVTVENAGIVVPSWEDRIDQPGDEIVHLGELMAHADLLIHLGSTIAVDAACFDTPIIAHALDDADPRLPRGHYARRVFDLTHNRYLRALDGMWLARTEEELTQAMQEYLYDPGLHREGRARIVQQICGRFDGQSGERIALFLQNLLDGRTARTPALSKEEIAVAEGRGR